MRKRIFDLDGVFYTFTDDFHAATATAMAQAAISLGAKLDLETAKKSPSIHTARIISADTLSCMIMEFA